MKKYLCFTMLFILVAVLIFRSTYPIEWHTYVLEKDAVANPFFTGETDKRGYSDEMEILDVKDQYALCAINHRVTEASKYWMAQISFQDTQKLAVLDLHDGSVLWEKAIEDSWILRGKLLEQKIFLYAFSYDKDRTNVTVLDFANNEEQSEIVLYEDEMLASYIEMIGQNPVVLEHDGMLYFEILKLEEKDIHHDFCVWEDEAVCELNLGCERLYCNGTDIYGLSHSENDLCLYSLSENRITKKNLKIKDGDVDRITNFFVLQNQLYFVLSTDNGMGQIYHYAAGRLQRVQNGTIKRSIVVSEDEIVFQGAEDALYQMNRQGKVKACPVEEIVDWTQINRELPFSAEETIEIYCLKKGERVENEFPIFSIYALKDDFIIGIDENFNIVKFEIQNILKTNKIFEQHEGINNIIKLQNGIGIHNFKDGYLYIYTID